MTGSTLAFLKAHPVQLFFFSFCFYLFIVGCAGSLLVHRFSLVVASRGYFLVGVRLLIAVASLVVEHGLYVGRLL